MRRLVQWHVTFNPPKIKSIRPHLLLDTDRDRVPDYKDCRPFNPRYHSREQFEKAKKHFGITKDPHRTAWILPSGEMLDFSRERGQQLYGQEMGRMEQTSDEQIAHWEIGKVTGFHGRPANTEFEKEGAIRFRKTPGKGMYAEMIKKPTRQQAQVLSQAIRTEPYPSFLVIEKANPNPKKPLSPEEQEYRSMETTSPHPVVIQKFIRRAWR